LAVDTLGQTPSRLDKKAARSVTALRPPARINCAIESAGMSYFSVGDRLQNRSFPPWVLCRIAHFARK